MKKHYEISVTGCATVFVAEAKDEQEAYSLARDVLDAGDFTSLEMTAFELKSDADIASSRRHADAKSVP